MHADGDFYFADLHEYDIAAARWTNLTDLSSGTPPGARTWAAMASVGGKVYVHGGTTCLGDLYEYDPATKTWTDLSAPMSGTPPQSRADQGTVAYDGKIYIYAGFSLTNGGSEF
eukprot:3615042-Rhodomonas_salina.2